MKFWVVGVLVGVMVAGCSGGDTTTVINQAPTATTTVTESSTTTTTATRSKPPRQKPEPSGQADSGPKKINGITDGPVIGVDLTADAYHGDMRVWGSLSYDTKVALARLFLKNNPNDCYALSEVVGSGAPIALARRVDLLMFAGTTGGMLISEVMLDACQAGAE